MENLQRIVAFWRDCITAEGALEQSFSVSDQFRFDARTRARLFQGEQDPFIFSEPTEPYHIRKGGLYDFIARTALKGQELYFGYPLLMFYDPTLRQHRVAPLFVIRLTTELHEDELLVTRAEPAAMLGSKAFAMLGLKHEEVAALNAEVGEIFRSSQKGKLEPILYLLKRETAMTFVEGVDPEHLSSSHKILPYRGTVIYNRAVVYASEATTYNLHILNDLDQLSEKRDLDVTALNYLSSPGGASGGQDVPVLPFEFDEYQLRALRRILTSSQTVITGPPGTGKSQFIANVIVNLFLQKKRVLFVSHTGEAVRVVNQRINDQFANLMMHTGNKEIRQDLGKRLAEMVTAYNDRQVSPQISSDREALARNWKLLERETAYLKASDALHARLARAMEAHGRLDARSDWWCHVQEAFYSWRVKWLTVRIGKRRSSQVVGGVTQTLKKQHVTLSRAYVASRYLAMIFENEQYGQLSEYIEAVQNRRPTQTKTNDRSEHNVDAALQAMSIWSCTLKSLAATFPLRSNLFDYVIFDEASQIDLPSAAPALYRANRAVVVGDAKQLLHIAKLSEHTEDDLAKTNHVFDFPLYPGVIGYREASLFNSAKRSLHEPELQLKNHYRSNPKIANMFSTIFYGGKLRVRTKNQTVPDGIVAGVTWEDVGGTSCKHKSGSRYNSDEVVAVTTFLKTILPLATAQHLTIGVATPYSLQRERIAESLGRAYSVEELASVRVLTVHQFQGSEVDILLFSTVIASNGDGGSDYWYMKNEQILNVAISRAKQTLIIVGDLEHALASQSKLKAIAEYCTLHDDVASMAPNRPMNVFERKLLELLIPAVPKKGRLEPQFVVDGRYTLDFAVFVGRQRLAIELDGSQHEIIGGLPVFEDTERDAYLAGNGWRVVRVTVYELLEKPDSVIRRISRALKDTDANIRRDPSK